MTYLTNDEIRGLDKKVEEATGKKTNTKNIHITVGSGITDVNDPEQRRQVLDEVEKGLIAVAKGECEPVRLDDGLEQKTIKEFLRE